MYRDKIVIFINSLVSISRIIKQINRFDKYIYQIKHIFWLRMIFGDDGGIKKETSL